MTTNDLVALLNAARQELAVLASYVDYPNTVWPNVGLKTTAKAHKRLVERIDKWMAEPVEDVPLRQENLALRAALAVRHNDEEWRLKYLKAELERNKARAVLAALCSEFDGAVAHADWRAAGSTGMGVPFTGDFASATQLPSVVSRMRWWAREMRKVLGEEAGHERDA